jgi:hypothetical protein
MSETSRSAVPVSRTLTVGGVSNSSKNMNLGRIHVSTDLVLTRRCRVLANFQIHSRSAGDETVIKTYPRNVGGRYAAEAPED